MIISHRHRFIFIKTRKTAGTSLEIYLSQFCNGDDVVTPIKPHVEPHRARNHHGLWNPLPECQQGGCVSALIDLMRMRRYYNHIPAVSARARIPRAIWSSYFKFCVERNPWDKTLSHYHIINSRRGGGLSLDSYLTEGNYCLNHPSIPMSQETCWSTAW